MAESPREFSLLVKPAGADCNLACDYCFYRGKAALYPGRTPHRMSDRTLETLISGYMAVPRGSYSFGWQGGEPTLMGEGFFRRIVELQSRHGRPGAVVANGLQTNATRISEPLAALFAEYRFLVGVSLDGPPDIHDRFRRSRGGQPSHAQVLQGLRVLQRHGVACNAVVTVNAANFGLAAPLYRYLKDLGFDYHQYIPIVEFDEGGRALPFTVRGEQWGEFLCGLYDAWLPDAGRVSVRLFDAVVARLVDGVTVMCTMGSDCRQYFAVEYNGDVYPCDFYVQPDLRLGNIAEQGWEELLASPRYRDFGQRKARWHPACQGCAYLSLCAGDCLKHRIGPVGSGAAEAEALSWLCAGWKAFYDHALSGLQRIARRLQRERSRELLAGLPGLAPRTGAKRSWVRAAAP
jgi:uncharacterized protein